MNASVETILPDEPAELAWERMRRRRIRHLVVLDGRQVVGVLSQRNLGSADDSALREGRTVRDRMTPAPITAAPETTVRQAANLLRGRTIGCLPVLEGDRLVGIVTVTDLLDLIGRGAERPVAQSKRWTLKHRGPRREPKEAIAGRRAPSSGKR